MVQATSSVDGKADALIQQAVRSAFVSCTVLTIAHRLHSVQDSDRILVLDQGRVAEFASPQQLLTVRQVFLSVASKHASCRQVMLSLACELI